MPNATAPPRQFSLSLPLVRRGRVLGDVGVLIAGNEVVSFERRALVEQLLPLLRPEAQLRVSEGLPVTTTVTPEDLSRLGIDLAYDPELLQIVVDSIDPSMAAVQMLGTYSPPDRLPVTLEAEDFSAYVNTVAEFQVDEFDDFEEPVLNMFGAVRFRNLVFEVDGGYDDTAAGPGFYRRQARLVYDQPERQRRFSAGDLRLESLRLLGTVFLGGVAVEKGRRIFNPFLPAAPTGAQELLIDRDVTVEVFSGGARVEAFELEPGTYDLSQLPARYGSTDVQLFLVDSAGRRQLVDYDLFFDPIDLVEGEDEYSVGVGFIPTEINFNPNYADDPVFTGFYRRGVSSRLVVGGGLQLSEDVQVASAEALFRPRSIPGRFDVATAFSTGDETGFAARFSYFYSSLQDPFAPQFSLSVDYESEGYFTVADSFTFGGIETLSVNASYSQPLSHRTTVLAGASYTTRAGFDDFATVYAELFHQLRDNVYLRGGIEYGNTGNDKGFGVRLGITARFGARHRADARYNSRRDEFLASFSRSYRDRVGSFGYDVGVRRSDTGADADVTADYVGNRFEARFSHIASGDDFDDIGESNRTRLQIGTSLAYAGGRFAIGRPIDDAFVIASRHRAFEEGKVITGRELRENRYQAASGPFGPALAGDFISYNRQTLAYDLVGLNQPVAVGSGLETLDPPYRGGYHLVVGSDAYVSAVGVLRLAGAPASLVTGQVVGVDDDEYGPQPFFTNSVGRFAVLNLRPGRTYRVELRDSGRTFTFRTPDDGTTVVRLEEITAGEPLE